MTTQMTTIKHLLLVTKIAKSFLMKIEEEPLFHIDEINPTLYNAVTDLNEVKVSPYFFNNSCIQVYHNSYGSLVFAISKLNFLIGNEYISNGLCRIS